MTNNCKIELTGNLSKAPVIGSSEKSKYGSFILTTHHAYVNEVNGKSQEKKLYHRVIGFNQDIIKKIESLKDDDKVRLTGTLSYSQFETKDGFKKYQASIVANEIECIN